MPAEFERLIPVEISLGIRATGLAGLAYADAGPVVLEGAKRVLLVVFGGVLEGLGVRGGHGGGTGAGVTYLPDVGKFEGLAGGEVLTKPCFGMCYEKSEACSQAPPVIHADWS